MKIDKNKCLLVLSMAASLTPQMVLADGLPQACAPHYRCHMVRRHAVSFAPTTTRDVYTTVTRTIEKPVYIDKPVIAAPAPEPVVQPVILEQQPQCESVIEQPMIIEHRERWHLFQLKIF
jgi:hypothetical protein